MNRVYCVVLLAIVSQLIAACQSAKLAEPIEAPGASEASPESIEIDIGKPISPPRTLNDLVAVFGPTKPVPQDCKPKQQKSRQNLDDLVAELHEWPPSAAHSLQFDANTEFTRGRIKHALKIQGWVASAFGVGQRWDTFSSASAHAGMAVLYGASGDVSGARDYSLRTKAILASRYISNFHKRTPLYRTSIAIADAAIALGKGNAHAAETSLRTALHYGVVFKYGLSTISRAWMQAQLVSVMVQQRKLLEAEVEARKAINELKSYSAFDTDVAIVAAQLARVLAEQKRNDEAILVAQRAINWFEADCVLPESIPYAQARRILVQVLIAGNNWQQAYDEVVRARQDLESDPGAFRRLFLSNTEVALALVRGGEAETGFAALSDSLKHKMARTASSGAELTNARAMIGVAHAFAGRVGEAKAIFDEVIPVILKPKPTGLRSGAAAHSIRELLILETALELYAVALTDMTSTGLITETEDTLFRISQAVRLSRVQVALSATAARGAASDDALAELVRDLQDSRNHLAATLESISFLTQAPQDQVNLEVLEELNLRAANLRQVTATLSARIDADYPRYAQLVNPTPLSVREARNYLEQDEAILRIHTAEDSTYVWAIAENGSSGFVRVAMGRVEIERWVNRLRAAIAPNAIRTIGDIPEYDTRTARAIYDALLRPLEQVWFDASHLLVVIDAPLSALPLSILVRDSEPELQSIESTPFVKYRSVKWLVGTHAFSSLPAISSLRSLKLLQRRESVNRPFVGFADPDFYTSASKSSAVSDHSEAGSMENLRSVDLSVRARVRTRQQDSAGLASLPRLPETARELKTIARILGADEINDVYLREKASETRVRSLDLSAYRVVAFATHGLLPGDLNGLQLPALALSAPQEITEFDDGLLTTDEIVGLNLSADWAVLSACNTGAGDGLGAEAVSGLGRAFIYAGASALLVSNWPVHSESTVELMIDLFSEQVSAKLTRSQGLRQAQLAMLSSSGYVDADGNLLYSYAHPIFWAPFTVIGNGR